MRTALFTNFTNEEFTGYWDGKGKSFKPGQSLYMPDYLARHFAKHLTNRELLRTNPNGSLVYRDGEKMTSPKKPEDSPLFMELFNKAYAPDTDEEESVPEKKDDIDTLIKVANKNKQKSAENDPTQPQTVLPPDFNDEEDENFEGKTDITN